MYRVITGHLTTLGVYSMYGDAQASAWDALRRGQTLVAGIQVYCPHLVDCGLPGYETMERWCIGPSGKFRHLDAEGPLEGAL